MLLTALLGLLCAGPALAEESGGGNPFLAEAGGENGDDKADKANGAEDSGERGSEDRCGGGWAGKADSDPMEPDPDEQMGKCGRCFGGDE
ncbi:hypothetical protein AN478_06075 [Thiohalorhabdus denitrificans]|nr:hypothetical protein AN478_06075 [Thiohalorhabdus denitrificans]